MTYAVDYSLDLGAANTGLTLLATITTMAGAAVASGVTGWTEYPSGSGVYWGSYAAFADGVSHRVIWLSGATLMASATATPADASIPVVKSKTDLIGAGSVTVSSPVATSGDVSIVRGDDYSNSDGRALEWTNAAGTWPDLTGGTVTLTVKQYQVAALTKAGSVVTPTGAGQKVRVELTAAETGPLKVQAWDFDVQVTLASGRKVTLVVGRLTVTQDYSV